MSELWSFEQVMNACAELGELKRQYKERCMVYHVDAKERMAEFYGKPLDFYYHLPVVEFDVLNFKYRLDCDMQRMADPEPFAYGKAGMIRTLQTDTLPDMRATYAVYDASDKMLGTVSIDHEDVWYGVCNGGEPTRFTWYIYAMTFACGQNPDRPVGEVDRFLESRARQVAALADYKQFHPDKESL